MSKVHALVPLTEQEELVQDLLDRYGIQYAAHKVFPVAQRLYVVDFYLLLQNLIIECWRAAGRRGSSLVWVEKNACYVDWKFERIKGTQPNLECLAFVEVKGVGAESVRAYVGPVLEHADVVFCSREELAGYLWNFRSRTETGEDGRQFRMV
ncbi:MAG: hypothetical protein LYZ66_06615 [Nitrososphaerales archaeon]|nr:hypothetical protein [Nitrososphaerales archaeon]